MRPVYVLIATLVAATTLAQPQPSSRLGDLKAFAGNWRCTGTAFQTNWGPEHPTTAKIKVTWVLGRHWLNVQYEEVKTKQNPNPASGHVHWGYDEGTKKLTGYGVNNFGGHVFVESDGWQGNTIVWSGTMSAGGASFQTRDTFVLNNPREVRHTTEAEMGGHWMKFDEETCRKTS